MKVSTMFWYQMPDNDTIGAVSVHEARSEQSTSMQYHVIIDLINYASAPDHLGNSCPDHSVHWQSLSPRVADAFLIRSSPDVPISALLDHFVNLYFKYFGQLWPLISPQSMDLNTLQPLLFLVLASIGSMYGDSSTRNFGTLLHNNIRPYLTVALELDDTETDFMWLAQARLLTQVAALYFGQPKAFSYAQHLGALLMAQASRMDLFTSDITDKWMTRFRLADGQLSDKDRLAIWLHLEARRRLAFGIFRAEAYMSVLLHTKPLLSMEDIDLELPMCDAVWWGDKMPAQVCLQLIEHDRKPGRGLWASDLFRIAMNRDEPLPALDSAGFELLQFGLQWPLWRLSRDPYMFQRLTGSQHGQRLSDGEDSRDSAPTSLLSETPRLADCTFTNAPPYVALSETDRLDSTFRKMQDSRDEYTRLLIALQKLEQALPSVKSFVHTERDRTNLMSGLISYHLAFLRLHAPIGNLHQIQYCLADGRGLDHILVESVKKWANSPQSRLAVERATSIWSLIAGATRKHRDERLKFNLLAFTGLHHSAVVLWVYANACESLEDVDGHVSPLILPGVEQCDAPIHVNRADSPKLIASFVKLYDLITPAKWSSFAQAASNLSAQEFPRMDRLSHLDMIHL